MPRRTDTPLAGRRRAGARDGFTLIELLVALTITGLIVSATYAALATSLDAADRNRAVERETHRERNARMVLTTLLRAARVDLAADPEGFRALQPSEAASGDEELHFVSALGFPFAGFPAQDLVRVRLWLAHGEPGTRALMLTLQSLHPGDVRQETIPLFGQLAAAPIHYRGPGDPEWRDRWDSRIAVPTALRLQFEGPRPRPDLIVRLPLAPHP